MTRKRPRKSSLAKGKQLSSTLDSEATTVKPITPIASHETSSTKIFQSTAEQRKKFWETFIRAIETEPLQVNSIKGSSGFSHPSIAAGVDRSRKRLIIISGDPDGRTAALVQSDIQAAYTDYKVILSRPIAINLAKAAQALAGIFGTSEIRRKDINRFSKVQARTKKLIERKAKILVEKGIIPAIQALGYAALNIPSTLQDVLIQLSHVQFVLDSNKIDNIDTSFTTSDDLPLIKFGLLLALDPSELDRQMGICSVPLYELSDNEVEIFHSGIDIEAAKEILKTHHTLQYFFPAADHLALGLIEKDCLSPLRLASMINRAPEIGHPFGKLELIPGNTNIEEIVDVLKDKGYAVEGEVGLELTESGLISRATVKYKPREGFLSKLSNVFSVKIDITLKDLLNHFNS